MYKLDRVPTSSALPLRSDKALPPNHNRQGPEQSSRGTIPYAEGFFSMSVSSIFLIAADPTTALVSCTVANVTHYPQQPTFPSGALLWELVHGCAVPGRH